MTEFTLTERQQREAEHFNKAPWFESVDLALFERPEYGPWNPYWTSYNLARQAYQKGARRLLDFGCGRGAKALRYAQLGFHVHGFDISDSFIGNARALAEKYGLVERAEFCVQPAESLNYPDEYFDVVVGELVLHHVDIAPAIREVYRVLKPGGLAVFKEPLDTPRRTWIRRHPPLSWIVPVGMKNVRDKSYYHDTPDEKQLTRRQLAQVREVFADLKLHRFRVAAQLAVFTRSKFALQKLDWTLFKLCPPLRRLGDELVLEMRKPAEVRSQNPV